MLYIPQSLKRCSRCDEWKLNAAPHFSQNGRQAKSLRPECAACKNARRTEHRETHGELRQCEQCGKAFQRSRPSETPRFCSPECYHANRHATVIKHCQRCGKPIEVYESALRWANRGVFCSNECRKVDTISMQCERCGKEFQCSASETRRRFCSKECQRPPAQISACVVCGKEFRSKPSENRRFCSRDCAFRAANEMSVGQKIDKKCERCGKEFQCNPSQANRRFCSRECHQPPTILTCEICGKSFRCLPSRTDQRFCSRACARRYVGETSIERKVRLALESLGVEFIQEYQIGRYSIDFALVNLRTAIEADGAYWHQINKARDERKDKYLKQGGWTVHRLPEATINACPDLTTYLRELVEGHH